MSAIHRFRPVRPSEASFWKPAGNQCWWYHSSWRCDVDANKGGLLILQQHIMGHSVITSKVAFMTHLCCCM